MQGKSQPHVQMMKLVVVLSHALACAHARAQPSEGDRVAVVVSASSVAVAPRLDAMLRAPTIPFEVVLAADADLLEALTTAPARYVVVVRGPTVEVVDRVDRRVVTRELEADLLALDPYAAALVVFELLEVVGAVPVPVEDDLEALVATPSRDPPLVQDDDVDAGAAGPEPTTTREVHVYASVGGGISRGLGGDLHPWLLALGLGAELSVSRYVLALGAAYQGPGHVSTTRTTSTNEDVRFRYRRSDFALRFAFGADGARFGYRLHASAGPSIVRVRARTREDAPRRGEDSRLTGALGLGVEGRVALHGDLWLTIHAGFDWLVGATPYGALGEFLLDEPRYRLEGSVGLVYRFGV